MYSCYQNAYKQYNVFICCAVIGLIIYYNDGFPNLLTYTCMFVKY